MLNTTSVWTKLKFNLGFYVNFTLWIIYKFTNVYIYLFEYFFSFYSNRKKNINLFIYFKILWFFESNLVPVLFNYYKINCFHVCEPSGKKRKEGKKPESRENLRPTFRPVVSGPPFISKLSLRDQYFVACVPRANRWDSGNVIRRKGISQILLPSLIWTLSCDEPWLSFL